MLAENPQTKDHPGVIAPPPLIFAGILMLALGIDWAVGGPGFSIARELRVIAGVIFCVAGLAVIIVAGAQFRLAKTNIEPWKPTTSIVTTGIYQYTRNPIYLGMAIGYIGLSLIADSIVGLA